MLRVLCFTFFVLISSFATCAPVTGPIKPEAVLHFYPELNAVGTAYRVPVVVQGVTGVAEIGKTATTARMLLNATVGKLGFFGMAAVTAAQLCYEQTDWKICHSTIDPILPISIDTSLIVPAQLLPVSAWTYSGSGTVPFYNSMTEFLSWYVATYGYTSYDSCYKASTTSNYNEWVCTFRKPGFSGGKSFYERFDLNSNYSCSSGVLSNSSGAPMAVTGQYCTPELAYSCPTNYSRSDAYGNLGDGMFCSYQAPTVSEQYRNDALAPYLLNYYANQLFSDNDGKLDPSYFSDADTTFDPTVTPSDMPVTWDQLKQYVDWVRTGVAQTTDPLAAHYVSPSNYAYTNNYISNNDSVTNNTSSATSTNITPQQTASSAAMTQAQFEATSKKLDTEAGDAIKNVNTDEIDNADDGGFGDANDQLTDIASGNIGDLPALPTPNLPGYSSCQTLDMSWKGHAAVFPSPSQCQKMEEAKRAFGYILYIITFIGLVWEILRRVE